MNVLIVDDHAEDRKILNYYLQNQGCPTLEAADGAQGLEIALANRPDLIISDALMPEMDGFQLLRKVRTSPELANTPFVFYSAVYTGNRDQELALALGADAFIVKPKEPDEFWRELSAIMEDCRLKKRRELPSPPEEEDYLREYGRIVATKLEEKVRELAQANREITTLNVELEQRVHERTAELEAANRELQTFSYSVSHDLRAPLTVIDGFTKIVMDDFAESLGAPGTSHLQRVRTACQRMSRLIDAMLDLSRLTAGELHRQHLNLSDIADEILGELHKSSPERTVKMVVGEGMLTYGDSRLLRVAMENLLSNAWKYTKNVKDAVIETGTALKNGKTVFFVRDNGAGFDMAYAGKLFSPFQRLHRQDEFEGDGIGLATVQRIIHRHGGTVWADAKVGEGATFYFTIG